MTFAFGQEKRREVLRNLSNLRTFRATRGGGEGLEGITGPCRRLTNVRYGALPHEYAHGLDDAVYVVYCYGTPIAWVTMADDATEEGRVNYMPDWQYSATTTYYQGLVHQAWGDKVVDPKPEKSREDNRGTPRGRSADVRYGRVPRGTVVRPGETVSVGRSAPSGPPEHLLDPRYSDPNWTPEPLPGGADLRDTLRVRADQDRRHPAHP